MPEVTKPVGVRPLDTVDIGDVVRIDEKITGQYGPEAWEHRIGYYLCVIPMQPWWRCWAARL